MPNPKELRIVAGKGQPSEDGEYLVAIKNSATSEYCPSVQVAYFERPFRSWTTMIYMPDDGTMEPTDITDVVIYWWHLPSL